MTYDPELRAHHDWIGLLQPVGVVASPPALVAAQAYVNRNVTAVRAAFDALCLPARPAPGEARKLSAALPLHLPRFARLAEAVLGWDPATDLVPTRELPESLTVPLPEYGETLAPTWAVPVAPDAEDPAAGNVGRWLLLVQELPLAWDLDTDHGDKTDTTRWHASPQKRFERLLRETGVPIGLLFNQTSLRLVYQPAGESSGHVTFPFALLCETQGAPALGALPMLLAAERLFSVPTNQRLPHVLRESRKYQNEVSGALARQVLDALWELVRGFQSAHAASKNTLLADMLGERREAIYGGLLTVLLRLVFVLFAEDQNLLPAHPRYAQNYALRGLYEKLREDAGRHPDTLDQQPGAWGWLVALFRFVHDGGRHGTLHLPARYGRLFDPDAYPFLEGRPADGKRVKGEVIELPKVSNGVVYRVLDKLLVLGGESLSYRTLDVEQLGGVYEELMGFTVEVATGPSVALTPDDVVVDLAALLRTKDDRVKALSALAGCDLSGAAAEKVKAAKTVPQLVEALGRRISARTPEVVAPGGMYLQPTEERRRSGSHYTPRSLTEPIVRTTLRPVLEALGARPTPAQILALEVCDPAMGSGAFLVAACRHLADALVKSWEAHGERPQIPPDEDEVLHARRLVAQHCLYGVDRNPFAVDLAKLSLWLATMAREHPFTFLDPVLKHGDSLVGLTRNQIETFDWSTDPKKKKSLDLVLWDKVREAEGFRAKIQALAGSDDTAEKRRLHLDAEGALADARMVGDLVVEAFFGATKDKERKARLGQRYEAVTAWRNGARQREALDGIARGMREGERPVWPFHWGVEFPEVFLRENPGFDAFVGNPPFAGKNTITEGNAPGYIEWLQAVHEESNGNADLVAHFFRRAFALQRKGGTFGLIATNTIAQGDTRGTGLRWICNHGGTIYEARKRVKWPLKGAAVVVSVVHAMKGAASSAPLLDGRPVERITAFLFPQGTSDDPVQLLANVDRSFQGSIVLGMGFTFDDSGASSGETTSVAEMRALIVRDPRNQERIFPFIGGEEINTSPSHAHHRYVINFVMMSEEEARTWPDLMAIVEAKVRPGRMQLGNSSSDKPRKERWWLYGRYTPGLYRTVDGKSRVLANSQVSAQFCFAWQPTDRVFAHTVNVFAEERDGFFAIMQSRVHEFWARFFGSSMKDDLRYTPSDCFETFPFPRHWEANAALEAIGAEYHRFRAALMVEHDEGLTKTYNRFHDPGERSPKIAQLRALHDAMDRAVLDAYGWTGVRPTCEFIAEHEEAEGEAEATGGRKKKRAMRYRWPDAVRDEVLAKLVELNAARAKEDERARAEAKVQRTLGGMG
jgi:hypothetical protein